MQKTTTKTKKYAILVWSNGYEMNYCQFSGATQEEADELARTQMWKEYDDHNYNLDANEECGSYKGDYNCYYCAEEEDSCIWEIIPVEIEA